MAAPHLAGTMALLKEHNPTWTPEELKALVMNNANHDLFTGDSQSGLKYGPPRVGSGRLDVAKAITDTLIAFNADLAGAVGVSFGPLEITTTTTLTRTIKVENKGGTAASLTLGYTPLITTTGVTFSFPDGPSVNVLANNSATFRLQLTVNPALLDNTHDPTVSTTQGNNQARYWLTEAGGLLTLAQSGGQTLRLPVYVAPRPASQMTTTQNSLNLSALSGTTSLTLSGQGVKTGNNYPNNNVSLVTPFELAGISSSQALTITSPADLQYVGINSDLKAQLDLGNPAISSTLAFALTTYANWSAPVNEVAFKILIDTNRDGTYDYALYNTRLAGTDSFYAELCVLPFCISPQNEGWLNGFSPATFCTNVFNSNVLVLPVKAVDLGLSNAAI